MLPLHHQQTDEHFLFPSTIFASNKPCCIQTILGSCIAVCLFDPTLGHGGINHFMLPWWNGQGIPSPKYGDIAMGRLIERMVSMGSRKENLVAKIFGGADQHSGYEIGTRNIVAAEKLLYREQINITARSTGGQLGRKVAFYSHTNQVLLRFLASPSVTPAAYENH